MKEEDQKPTLAAARVKEETAPTPTPATAPEVLGQASIGVFAEGNVNVRHDGVTLTAVTPGGPADQAGIRAGDTILAINDHYLFTIAELRDSINHLAPGAKAIVRYRRYSSIVDVSLTAAGIQ